LPNHTLSATIKYKTMRVFVIPSWYPSDSNPIYGTFMREQIEMMGRESDNLQFGVSLWGQGDDPYLLYAQQPLQSFVKWLSKSYKTSRYHKRQVSHYFSPAYTWTTRLSNGNLDGIISANRENMNAFIDDFGRPDIIHVQASYPGAWIGHQLSQEFGIPYIVTLRMSPFPFGQFLKKNGQLKPGVFKVLEQSSKLIATSESLQTRVNELGLYHTQVVHNPVDLNFFVPKTKARPDAPVKLLAVGRLEPQKGFDILIKAIAIFDHNNVELTIIGQGTESDGLEDLTKRLDLTGRITFFGEGSRQEVRKAMQNCDLYILSSRHETFGNVVLEAMACGKPVVATKCGGPESIVTSDSGLLCEPESPELLAKAISQALDKTWSSDVIRAYVEQNFSSRKFTDHMMGIYKEVADK